MNSKRTMSIFLIFALVFGLTIVPMSLSYADTMPYSGMDISTGHQFPINVIKGPDGKLYVTEYSGNVIIKMDIDGQNKTTFASGLNQPIGMTFDASGNLYVAEHSGSAVKKIAPDGTVTVVKNSGMGILTGIVKDSSDKLFAIGYSTGTIYKMDLDGSNFTTLKSGLQTSSLIGLTIDANDNLYATDRYNNKVIKITPDGTTTDFATNITGAQGITLADDGYFYVVSTGRLVTKLDSNGTLVTTYSTGTFTPWGVAVDVDGYIYFTESSSAVKCLVGYTETLDKTTIKLTMNKDIAGTVADPAAFSITGVATNPNVTAVTTSGAVITISLDAPISPLESSVKVHYAKTGTNNLTVSGSATEFKNFSNVPVKNNILRVLSTAAIENINVANGTLLADLNLPSTAIIQLSNITSDTVNVTWDNGTPPYDGSVAGTYVFTGTFSVGANVGNPNNVTAQVNVVVAEVTTPHVISIDPITDISVAYGTAYNTIVLPSQAGVHLSDSTTLQVPVIWGNPTPDYVATSPGVYVITGTLNSNAFLNPSNMKASVNVIVGNAPPVVEPTPEPDKTTEPKSNTIVKVNGEEQPIGIEVKSVQDGVTTVEVSVIARTIDQMIENAIKTGSETERNLVEITVVDTTAAKAVVALTGDIVQKLNDNDFDILIKRGDTTYNLPAEELSIASIASQLSISADQMKSIQFEIVMELLPTSQQNMLAGSVQSNNSEILFPATEFNVLAKVTTADGTVKEVPIGTFTQYVERTFELPANADITTGIVFNSDHTYSHVPTYVFTKDGKQYARINSLTNSAYAVIHNSVKVKGISGHWAESIVNNLASRLIIATPDSFKANAVITRAELAEYLVRALGLYRADHTIQLPFSDVSKTSEHALAISIANEWDIINGYTDGTFKPDAPLTREEAMTMYAKALAVAQYQAVDKTPIKVDLSTVAPWAKSFIQSVLDAKVFVGRTDGSYDFKAPLTHAEALAAIQNILNVTELTD